MQAIPEIPREFTEASTTTDLFHPKSTSVHDITLPNRNPRQSDTQQAPGNATNRLSISPCRNASLSTKTSMICSPVDVSDDLGTCAPTPSPKPKCFRISGVPINWRKDDLLAALQDIDPCLKGQNYKLSLYPACCGLTQTALLYLYTCTEYFKNIKSNEDSHVKTDNFGGTDAILVLDCHFYDLTPMNNPEIEIVADVVAVTGLAGHAFGSWMNRETHQMWLKDFLPNYFKNIRIMSYGYDSSLIGHKKNQYRLSDYRRNFIQQLENSRSSAKSRPIIFIGHSMGGILILQALVESKRNPRYQHFLDSIHGIFLFGTPHGGLRTDELEEMVDTDSGGQESRLNLLGQLKEGSEFLETQKEDLLRIWGEIQGKIISFYETAKTPTTQKLESGKYQRSGPEVMMVERFSAALYLPCEHRLPVGKSHTDMVKFASEVDTTFQTVVKHIRECFASSHILEMLLSTIESVKPDRFLRILSTIDQEEHKPTIPVFDRDHPKHYWIFRNMDFEKWDSANSSQVLWLSGPPECSIHQVASYIVTQAKKRALETPHSVLYFFCSTATMEKSIATVFIHTLLHQFISYSANRASIVRSFLRTLLKEISQKERGPNPKPTHFKREDSSDTTIKKILNASTDALWDALNVVLGHEQKREFSIVIDGLDKLKHQKGKFIREVRALIVYLQERTSKVKALLTSQPQAEIKVVLDGLPYIEYDKERKECLANLRFNNTRYDKILKEHKGSLEWLWTHKQYKEWSASAVSRLLYIQGKPGSGKSTLTKYFKDNFLKREQNTNSAIVANFFYSYREGDLQKSHYSMLRSVLYDILSQKEYFFFHFQPEHRKYQALLEERSYSDLGEWHYESLKRILLSLQDHPQPERLYLIIDAIDESNEKDRRNILQLLFDLCLEPKYCVVKVFVASRPVIQLEHRIKDFHNFIRLQDETIPDISSFAHSFLNFLNPTTGFLNRATEYIVEHAQGVFLWVQLVKEELLDFDEQGYPEEDIFEFLRSLPTELEEFYERILEKLGKKDPDVRDGVKMFRFVLFTCRPLTDAELLHALGIPDNPDTEFTPSDQYFQKRIPSQQRIIHCGGNFLEIKRHLGSSIVQVMHQTVREFFLRPDGCVASSKFRMSEKDAHTSISITCIRYLMLCAASSTLANRPPNIKLWTSKHFEDYAQYLNEMPLTNYALCYLKHHMESCHQNANVLHSVAKFIDELTGNPASYFLGSWVASHLNKSLPACEQDGTAENFRNRILHAAVRMGFCRAADSLLLSGAQIEARLQGKTPLIVSTERGDDIMASMLLEKGADVNGEDDNGYTALHRAAARGQNAVARLLLEKGADADAKDKSGCRALHRAAESGQNGVAHLLLEKGTYVNVEDFRGCTALHWAVENGQNAVARLLLEKGADVNAKDNNGYTALHQMAKSGQDAVARLLLEKGASVNSKDYKGCTALHLAAESGHEAIVQLLVQTGANVIAEDHYGYTAQRRAALNGHGTIARLLSVFVLPQRRV